MDTRLNVEVDEKLKRDAQIKALQNGTSLKNIVNDALRTYLEKEEQQESKSLEIN